jgi:RimK family alpha-L-glutamate ligase
VLSTPSRVAVLGSSANETNVNLVSAWRALGIDAELVAATEARRRVRSGSVALARIDVLPALAGVEPGLLELMWLERSGVPVINTARALLAAHDKLRTARLMVLAGIPHPRTVHARAGEVPEIEPPLVIKPRFGSWGRDVFRCESWPGVARVLQDVQQRPWFRRHGALLQELIPPRGHDLRILVARGRVVGAAERTSAAGEWRTNVALGGGIRSTDPPPHARMLAVAATQAIGADFVGVDLLERDGGRYIVLELNGAVEFKPEYALGSASVFEDIAVALELGPASARAAINL